MKFKSKDGNLTTRCPGSPWGTGERRPTVSVSLIHRLAQICFVYDAKTVNIGAICVLAVLHVAIWNTFARLCLLNKEQLDNEI